MNRLLLALAVASFAIAGCKKDLVCPTGAVDCDGHCRELDRDPTSCGACGHACGADQLCEAGQCHACNGACGTALYAACYWTNEVKPLSAGLGYGGPTVTLATATPMRVEVSGDTLLAIAGWPLTSVSFVPLAGGPLKQVTLPGYDLEGIAVTGGAAIVTNASVNTLEILSLDGRILDEIPMPDQQSFINPMGVAVRGTSAYVALNEAQQVLRFDLSQLSTCVAADPAPPACNAGTCSGDRRCIDGTCRLQCGSLAGVIDLLQVAGAADGAAHPMPNQIAVAGGKVFVALSNLQQVDTTCDGFHLVGYAQPAGSGRLAMIDPDVADTVSIIDLGAGCKSPSAVVARGSSLWVSCGAYCFSETAPGALVEVDLSTGVPVVGTPIALGGAIPGQLAFCGTDGYVTDQRKTGAVVRFDPSTGTVTRSVAVCGADSTGNAWAADIVCKP